MALNLKQLEAFIWVADLGSFRRAAERLNTTQPNISTRIAGLEAALMTTLMERDAGSVRLTAKGREILEHARQVLRANEALIEAAQRNILIEGTLRLGVTELIVHTWLRDFLKELREELPSLHVELTVDLSVQLEQALAAGTLDLALQNAPFSIPMAGEIELAQYPSIWVASPSLGLAAKDDITAADICAHPLLTHARNTRLFDEINTHFSSLPDVRPRLVPSSNLAACAHMAIEGMGIAALPQAMITKELEGGDLVPLPYHWHPQNLVFMARYDAHRVPRYVTTASEIAAKVAARG
ncbi:LysR family transcriptional regulator [Falsihalocynthiibacter sp. SS001]|uniref:LysR family transcriptional regulator n=1 Tax=Falsihalocynthiibacter sp. SS001 TaxID=3349698 RepID=UPI0036D25733